MITDYLDALAKVMEETQLGAGTPTPRFVLNHGCLWTPAALPAKYERGTAKACYLNSAMLAANDDSLVYCEGYGTSSHGFSTEHAWCVDRNGVVVDPTWSDPESCTYFGIPFKTGYLMRIVTATGQTGLLHCYKLGWPLQQGKVAVDEWLETSVKSVMA